MRISNLHDGEDEFVAENDKLYILREITRADHEPIGKSQRVRGTSCYVVATNVSLLALHMYPS